ncbi:MAG: carbohydrate binding family 9 domain-containing protein [Fidelibacterota bacterium]|nr:MAG: carbohydrate binding family 9 domain-containing protein [Candidatus Neomarinimicrobiota bacterium]
MIRKYIIAVICMLTAVSARVGLDRSVAAVRFARSPVMDGLISEDVWDAATPLEDFIQYQPQHGQPSRLRTTAYIGYSQDTLFVAFVCFDPEPDRIASARTKRDSDLWDDDAVVVMLDTFDDDRTCTVFATNSIDTQWDFRVADNGRTSDDSWDASWSSAAIRTAEGWSVEFAIPFSSIRFQAGEDATWGLNLGRSCPRQLEVSYWVGPLEGETRVSQFGSLTGLDLSRPVKRYEFIPYGLAQMSVGERSEGRVGLDLRYRIGSSLSLEMTVNPDFATIEADVARINLTRFEQDYPEKRPFFLEGAEFFDQRVRQFYSRRIGEIPWGAKLVGKLGSFDLAVLTARSRPLDQDSVKADAGYTIVRAVRSLFGPSSIGFLAADRAWRNEHQGSLGFDGTFFFTETLGMTAQLVRAHGPRNDGALTWFVRPAFDNATSHFHLRYSHWETGLMDNLNAAGFIRDDDRREFDTNLSHTFWIKERAVESIETDVNYKRYWSQAGALRSWELRSDLDVVFANKWVVEFSHNEELERYEKDFLNRETSVDVGYDNRAGRSAEFSYGFGRNYDSALRLLGGEVSYKLTSAWTARYALTRLRLDPEPEDPEDSSTWIHVVRSDFYFNKDLYLKLFYQTNSVIKRENAQVVLVWRFLPPFGSVQVAYQRGSSRIGTTADQGPSLFTKLSWVL